MSTLTCIEQETGSLLSSEVQVDIVICCAGETTPGRQVIPEVLRSMKRHFRLKGL